MRAHAVWVLARIRTEEAKAAPEARIELEHESAVCDELALALANPAPGPSHGDVPSAAASAHPGAD